MALMNCALTCTCLGDVVNFFEVVRDGDPGSVVGGLLDSSWDLTRPRLSVTQEA